MSTWKLVEAVAEESPAKAAHEHHGGHNTHNHHHGHHGGRGDGRGRHAGRATHTGGRGRGHNGNNTAMNYTDYLTPADRNYLSHMAVQQIEFIFNLDNLCGDTFVRSYMDVDGFVPLPLLCTYQNVACYCAPYADVVEKMKTLSAESSIEFNSTNETVRIKSGWENWLMPNTSGGRGVPRYVKQSPEQQQAYMEQLQYAYAGGYAQPQHAQEEPAEKST